MNKVALITGASRGIGRVIVNKLAEKGYNVVITAKTIDNNNNLPGTIYDVQNEISNKYKNVSSLAMQLDVRNYNQMKDVVKKTIKEYGKIDAVIHNAGALHWKSINETYHNKYDLINNINSRASFLLSQLCLKYMKHDGYGHIIMHSPPLPNPTDIDIYKNKTAYMISKLGMTMTAMGIASEYKGTGIAANTIWPSTPIESFAVKNHKLGEKKMWRKADIIGDSIIKILEEDPNKFTGNQLIDEEYLRSKGVRNFGKYQCVKGHEPPKLLDIFNKFVK
jgi:citronellol/citronellal dehydrogenase